MAEWVDPAFYFTFFQIDQTAFPGKEPTQKKDVNLSVTRNGFGPHAESSL